MKSRNKKASIFWIVNLSIVLLLEIILACMVGNPIGGFKNLDKYTYNTPNQNIGINVNPTTGVSVTAEEQTTEQTKEPVSNAVKTLLDILPIIVVTVFILGAVAWIGLHTQ